MNESPEIEKFLQNVRRKRWLKRLRNVLGWLLVALILLTTILWFVAQNEGVQNWAVDRITNNLTEKLGTPVRVDSIHIDFFDKLVLDGLYIEDDNQDTLLYSGQLSSSLTANLLTLIGRDLEINEITLQDAVFNLRQKPGEKETNLQRLLEKLKTKEKKKTETKGTAKPFFLKIGNIYLKNVRFVLDNEPKGEAIYATLPDSYLNVGDLDLVSNRFEIRKMNFKNADVIYVDKLKKDTILPGSIQLIEEGGEDGITREVTVEADSLKKPLFVSVLNLDFMNASFKLRNYRKAPVKTTTEDVLDWRHLNVDDIRISIDSLDFTEGQFEGRINQISCLESSGFILNKLAADKARVSGKKMEFYGLDLITPNSSLGDTLIMKYRSFKDFQNVENKVLMQAYFNDSEVALQDIMVFAPALQNNTFFINSYKEIFALDGYIYGTINSLKGRNVKVKIGTDSYFSGDFSTKNLAVRNEEFMSMDLKRLKSDVRTLRQLIPNFNPPDNFDKLGGIDFTGNFDGFFNDFSAFGRLKTDLGVARMDMGLDITQGRAQAKYYGNLALENFDLGTWTDNKKLGTISFSSKLSESQGLTLETVSAHGTATIEEFTFRDYSYTNINLDGQLQKNYFNGKLIVKEEFIDLDFDGAIDFVDSIPKFDFKANVGTIDFKGLNLIKPNKPNVVLSGKLDLLGEGRDFSTMIGTAHAYGIEMEYDGLSQYALDSIYVFSDLSKNNIRTLRVASDILQADLLGQFDVQEVPEAILQFLERNFPEVSDRVGIKSNKTKRGDDQVLKETNFNFDIKITDSQNFTDLLANGIDTIRNARAKGFFDSAKEKLELNATIPFLQYKKFTFDELYLDVSSEKQYAEIEAGVYRTLFQNQQYEPVDFEGVINRDTMQFGLNSTNFNSLLDDLNINGEFFFTDEYFQVRFMPSDLVILENKWNIDKDNYIRFGKGFVETKNFDLHSLEKRIGLESVDDKGLKVDLENIRLSLIDDFWDYSKLDFDGRVDINATIGDVFKMTDIKAVAVADTLEINGDDWGVMRLDAEMKDTRKPVELYLTITKGQEQITAEGFVGPFGKGIPKLNNKDYLLNVNIINYPLSIAEYFIGNGISNTLGTFDAEVRLDGDFNSRPNINGTMETDNLALTIDYLQTRYKMDKGYATISNSIFDATGNTLTDEKGNIAYIEGGIIHDHLSNFGLNATISSDEFLFLDTDVEDNALYYGKGYGSGLVKFTGTFKQTEIFIDAKTNVGTKLSIPVSYEQNASEVTFIKYRNKNEVKEEEETEEIRNADDIRGVNVNMFLDITDDAEVFIIFDERAGDKIRGRGEGNVQLTVTRTGEIGMYGDYIITDGEYLFTLLNVVNKPFKVKKGGTIKWVGDPFNADIDLEATYPGRTTLWALLIEYFDGTNAELESLARKSTAVDLIMYLNGKLLKPEINFDINFPNVDNSLRNFVESKLNSLRADQNELNRQVFGLMVVGSFLPAGDALNGRGLDIGFNTVTEMLSSQLSIYLTELLSEVFTDVGFISGIDFDINYNIYTADGSTSDGEPVYRTGSELELRLRNNFSDRLSVNMGGNVDWGGTGLEAGPSEGAFLAGDIVLEYVLTKDRRFKVRFYQLTDQTVEGRRNKTGAGFSYRREFDTFSEFIGGMKRAAKKAN